MTEIPTIERLDRTAAMDADAVIAYAMTSAGVEGVIVEVRDARETLLARTIVQGAPSREAAADAVMRRSAIERYGDYMVVPATGKRKLRAVVGVRLSAGTSVQLRDAQPRSLAG
ncbi:hypothetical protein [Arenivirga flava]|uniref:Uncharacterized protein n=1 Tax=Arenivirga flava TaxID=1930060 RepID=A0AA37UG84_9MICO|nr:hypothetical protein [Arenivirga flava]GMA29724.1 hypothetical protein GCM10025874_29770 [Arenivirga flava]